MVDNDYDREYPERGCLLFIAVLIIIGIILHYFIN